MDDRTLLELAAKAAGIVGTWEVDDSSVQGREYFNVPYDNHNLLSGFEWNPLREDSDALRLLVKLGIDVRHYPKSQDPDVCAWCETLNDWLYESYGGDPYAATRRAIVRAAADIGESK